MSSTSSCVEFLRRLIQTESLPGEERDVAALVKREMERLAYDQVRRDAAGNIIGLVRGQGYAPPVMLNTHLDHVDVGDPAGWPHPPFGGDLHDEKVWGRGAVDIKGPLAAQLHGVANLIDQGIRPPGDVYVTAVVQEEVGGLGARHLLTHLKPPLIIVGEPSSNQVRRGHRGRTELVLHALGRSVHASVPAQGINPLEVVARFILGLPSLDMPRDEDLGPSSVAPTLIRTDQISPNVIPSEVWLTCDWRNIPGETGEEIRSAMQGLAQRSLVEGAKAEVSIPAIRRVSYTGFCDTIRADNPAFCRPTDDAALRAAQATLADAIGLQSEPGVWRFATDGGHFSLAGLTVVGFGPGDERLAHTVWEAVPVAQLEAAMQGYQALALEWSSRVALFSGGEREGQG
ncbi:MAG: M20 family metallopeptidase [Acidobacteriota bacterium]